MTERFDLQDLTIHGQVDSVGAVSIERLIDSKLIASAVHWLQTESTNSNAISELRQLAESGHMPATVDRFPRLYVADRQMAGRGRHGRTWISDSDALTFSLVIRPDHLQIAPERLALAVGVSVAQTIEFSFAPLNSRLKWPNDVLVDGGKVAGILLETTQGAPDHFVIGVGVNIDHAPELGPTTATRSLAKAVGRPVCRYGFLESLIETMIAVFREDDRYVVNEFRRRCNLTGHRVTFQNRDKQDSGVCRGIDDSGKLVIETDAGKITCVSGEVSRVRKT